jgi:hypothetical protein
MKHEWGKECYVENAQKKNGNDMVESRDSETKRD